MTSLDPNANYAILIVRNVDWHKSTMTPIIKMRQLLAPRNPKRSILLNSKMPKVMDGKSSNLILRLKIKAENSKVSLKKENLKKEERPRKHTARAQKNNPRW